MTAHRSVSQLKTYEQCPYRYYLSRIAGVWHRPAAWLPQGTAVHEALEVYERSQRKMLLEDVEDVFREAYQTDVSKLCETTPNFEFWFQSGPYGGELDVERRYQLGLDQISRYFTWIDNHPEEVIWIAPDGTLGIELGFDIDLDGVRVKGCIDQVVEVDGRLLIRDHKTGNKPGDDFQLGAYAVAIAETYGIDPPATGDYWMGRTGKATKQFDLSAWSRDRVATKFRWLEEQIQTARFDPKPGCTELEGFNPEVWDSSKFLPKPDAEVCRFCDVRSSCDFAM